MMAVEAGERAPDVTLEGPDGAVELAALLRDGPVILTFYQEAGTPACSAQLRAFRDDHGLVAEVGARLVAVSVDSRAACDQFAATLAAPFPLLTDLDGTAARAFGVYDAEARRAQRSVFVIGEDGVVRLALPWYNPANTSQYEQVFGALGLGG